MGLVKLRDNACLKRSFAQHEWDDGDAGKGAEKSASKHSLFM